MNCVALFFVIHKWLANFFRLRRHGLRVLVIGSERENVQRGKVKRVLGSSKTLGTSLPKTCCPCSRASFQCYYSKMYYSALYEKLPNDLCGYIVLFAGDVYRAHQRDHLRQVYCECYKQVFGQRFVFKHVLRDPLTLDYYVAASQGLRRPRKKQYVVARHRKPFMKDIRHLGLHKHLNAMLHTEKTWWNFLLRSVEFMNVTV